MIANVWSKFYHKDYRNCSENPVWKLPNHFKLEKQVNCLISYLSFNDTGSRDFVIYSIDSYDFSVF